MDCIHIYAPLSQSKGSAYRAIMAALCIVKKSYIAPMRVLMCTNGIATPEEVLNALADFFDGKLPRDSVPDILDAFVPAQDDATTEQQPKKIVSLPELMLKMKSSL